MVRKTFKYRCYPNTGTAKRAKRMMSFYAGIWNRALKERIETYQTSKKDKTIKPINSYFSQYGQIRKRDHPELKNFDAQSMQDVLIKLHGSYRSFFVLIKKDPDARPPREKNFYHNITYRQSGWKLDGNILILNHVGRLRLRLHRPIEGKIKTVSVSYQNRKWYIGFSCEIPKKTGACSPMSEVKSGPVGNLRQEYIPSDGSDTEKGCAYNGKLAFPGSLTDGSDPKKYGHIEIAFVFKANIFIIDSDGFIVENPEFYTNDLDRLAKLNQRLSQKVKHSNNWYKTRYTLRKWHEKIKNKRAYYLWNLARFYAENYERVTICKWPLKKEIQYSIDNKTAMKLCDGAYGLFVNMLRHKCNELGTEFIERKDLLWQQQIERLTEQAKMEKLLKVLREAKRAVKRNYHARFRYLETACERLMTLRI